MTRGQPAKPFEEIEHTADVAMRATGRDHIELFANAAHGLYWLLYGEGAPRAEAVRREVSLEAPDLETLLVDWLGELLYWSEAYGEGFDRLEIHSLDSQHLRATVQGSRLGAPRRQIKAVTYHGLSVECDDGGCRATITFDV